MLLTSIHIKADYRPIPIPKLLDRSRLVVTAEVVKIEDTFFEAKITKIHKGNWELQYPIKIQKFNNWTCAQIRANYQLGQKAIYFLQFNPETKLFYALSAGNEGEMPIFEGCVYQKMYTHGLEPFKEGHGKFDTSHGTIIGFQYSLQSVETAIQKYFNQKEKLEEQIQDGSILNLAKIESNEFYRRIMIELIYGNHELSTLLYKEVVEKRKKH